MQSTTQTYGKFIKKNLQERKEFVNANKLCWSCLSMTYFEIQNESIFRKTN